MDSRNSGDGMNGRDWMKDWEKQMHLASQSQLYEIIDMNYSSFWHGFSRQMKKVEHFTRPKTYH